MKAKIIFLLCMVIPIITFGQNQKLMDETTCTPPKFTGVKSNVPMIMAEKIPSIENFLSRNVTYPDGAKHYLNQGTEVVKFIVTPKGEVADIEIVNSVCTEIDEEVIRTISATSGMWQPGNNNGIPVAMEKEVSVVFRLEDSKYSFNELCKKYYLNGAEMLFTNKSPGKALKYFDKGITLLPNETGMLALRGLTRFELGDKEGAIRDWTRVKNLGGPEGAGYIEGLVDLKGYAEMKEFLGR